MQSWLLPLFQYLCFFYRLQHLHLKRKQIFEHNYEKWILYKHSLCFSGVFSNSDFLFDKGQDERKLVIKLWWQDPSLINIFFTGMGVAYFTKATVGIIFDHGDGLPWPRVAAVMSSPCDWHVQIEDNRGHGDLLLSLGLLLDLPAGQPHRRRQHPLLPPILREPKHLWDWFQQRRAWGLGEDHEWGTSMSPDFNPRVSGWSRHVCVNVDTNYASASCPSEEVSTTGGPTGVSVPISRYDHQHRHHVYSTRRHANFINSFSIIRIL